MALIEKLLRERHPAVFARGSASERSARLLAASEWAGQAGWKSADQVMLCLHSIILIEGDVPAGEPRSEAVQEILRTRAEPTARLEAMLHAAARASVLRSVAKPGPPQT